MNAWPEILTDCERLLSEMDEQASSGQRLPRRPSRPEAAFRFKLREEADGSTSLENIVGGIPELVTSIVHTSAARPSVQWLPPGGKEEPIGVVMRRPRREDLYVFYCACEARLVVYTLPEEVQSKLILLSLQGDDVIQRATLGENVCRIEFSKLKPGSYLVASFSTIDLDALQREAQLLRTRGRYARALALHEETLELEPKHFLAWTRKGYALRAMNRPDEAMAAVEEALKVNPEFAFAWRAKGALLRDAGESQEGLNCYLRSLELDATDFLCWRNKGNALMALGRQTEAQEAYAKADEVRELYPEERH